MMRFLKTTMFAFILGGLIIAALSCTSASKTTQQNQTVAVRLGNLTVDITGAGNLALSQKDDLAFEIAGTVAEVLVTEGDTVEKGQVLAKLDTSDWETQLSALEDKVTAAERQLTAKERAVTTAERQPAIKKEAVTTAERLLVTKKEAVTTAERLLVTKKHNVTAKENDVLQAEVALKDARTVLDRTQVTYTVAEYTAGQAAVDAAKTEIETAQQKLSRYEQGTDAYWAYLDLLTSAQSKLKTAQAKLDDMLSGFKDELTKNQRLVNTAQWNLESAQIAVEDARIAVEDAQKGIENARIAVEDAQKGIETARIAVEDAEAAVDDARLAVEDAQKALDNAQKALNEAESNHPEVIAPFAGFITKVNVKGGDEAKKGTVAMTLADPNKFEADILVNETDILQTKLGGNASVQVEAVPGLSLAARVTQIAPTATIQSGVVNYKVKVEVASLQSVMQARQQAIGNIASGNVTSGAPSGGFRRPFGSGNLTQNQIEEMRKQRQQGQAAPPALPAMISRDVQLREGQTVTVSILVAERQNVLLVPNGAITHQEEQNIVKVMKDGVIEERPVTVGISNWQYTEVSSGLSEGEEVLVPQSTAPTPTTSQQNQRGMRIAPGMGGFGR